MPAIERVGVLVDAAVSYDRSGTNDYFDLDDSFAAITNLVLEARTDLEAKGFTIAFVEAPFVGSFKAESQNFSLAPTRKDHPAPRPAPFWISESLDSDPGYRQALITASRRALEAVGNRGEFPTDVLRAEPATFAALKTISGKKGVRYLFVVQGQGVIVSGGKQFGQGLGTALLSSVISFGNVIVVAHNVSFLDSFISLLDLETAEVVWSNSLRLSGFNPANPDHYRTLGDSAVTSTHRGQSQPRTPRPPYLRWANNVLYWFPPRGQTERPPDK